MLSKTYRGIRESQRRISLPPSAKNEAMAEPSRPFKLGVFVGLADDPPRSPASRSPRGFGHGAVGLGIVAAMSAGEGLGAATRTEPIPIVSAAAAAARPRGRPPPAEEELSESYTCVISHVGGNAVRKRVYLNDGTELNGNDGSCEPAMGVFFKSSPVAPPRLGPPPLPEDFLSSCYLCRKNLNGLDIFMYRGEKAFCSVECRCQQILSDEVWEKCGSEALKQYDCSVSPRSTPLPFTAGLAAA